jgi:hypothetical protein
MKPNLLETFERLLDEGWRGVFSQQRIFSRVRCLSIGLLVSVRSHLLSNAICAAGRQFQDWTADYRVWSQSPWEGRELFDPILDALPGLLASAEQPVLAALDDTMAKKTGRRIPGVAIGRDPMSPPFHVNLCYGLRFVQISVLVTPLAGGAARALPVCFEFAPPAVKPKIAKRAQSATSANAATSTEKAPPEKASPEKNEAPAQSVRKPATLEELAYKQEKKLRRLPQVGLNAIISLRESLDARPELRHRKLVVSGDGSYTTRLVLQGLPHDTIYIGRIRKDAKLHFPVESCTVKTNGRPRQYGPVAPTPDEIYLDASKPWIEVRCFVAGQFRAVLVKVSKTVYWRNAGVNLPTQVVVIKAAGYRLRKGGKTLYRHPAYLISTDPGMPLSMLVQAYLYRWEIECNHRDEKSLLGVAEGHVRNPEAVRRLPQLQVATYSLLLLASLLSSGFTRRGGEYLPLPKWRHVAEQSRPSLLDMLNLMRHQIFARSLAHPALSFEAFTKTAPTQLKASKPLSPEILTTFAA